MESLCRVYRKWIEKDPNEKIVILSKFKKFLDIVAEALKRRYHKHPIRFDGSKSLNERVFILERFRNTTGLPSLITPKSGGAELNIEFAFKIIQCEVISLTKEYAARFARTQSFLDSVAYQRDNVEEACFALKIYWQGPATVFKMPDMAISQVLRG